MSSHSKMRYSSRTPITVWSQLSCWKEGGKLLRGNGREKWSLAADQIHSPLHLHSTCNSWEETNKKRVRRCIALCFIGVIYKSNSLEENNSFLPRHHRFIVAIDLSFRTFWGNNRGQNNVLCSYIQTIL